MRADVLAAGTILDRPASGDVFDAGCGVTGGAGRVWMTCSNALPLRPDEVPLSFESVEPVGLGSIADPGAIAVDGARTWRRT